MTEKNGVDMIAAERLRQIAQKGYTAEHDDAHAAGELAAQAARLVAGGTDVWVGSTRDDVFGTFEWPGWYTKTDREEMGRVRQLVIAGALLAAEIDRLQRAATPQPEDEE